MKANGKANGKAAAGETHDDYSAQRVIAFDDAVEEGKKVIAVFRSSESVKSWRLGQLADQIEPRYGERTLENLPKRSVQRLARLNGVVRFGPLGKTFRSRLRKHFHSQSLKRCKGAPNKPPRVSSKSPR